MDRNTLREPLEWAVSMPDRGECGRGDTELIIPSYFDSTVCINNWNGAVHSSTSGECSRSEHDVTFLGDYSTKVCINRWNGALRISD